MENENVKDATPKIVDVKSQVAQMLIEAMKTNSAPWQKPWDSRLTVPINATTGNPYKGVNFLLLSLSAAPDPRWVSFKQAQDRGWRIKKGAKGSVVVKVVDLSYKNESEQGQEEGLDAKPRFALKRYFVFNASQVEGIEPLKEEGVKEPDWDKAQGIMSALIEKTQLSVVHTGSRACYVPSRDQILIPKPMDFHSEYDYYATILHEAAHSTLSEKRLNRTEALAKKWGDNAYANEELRAEISSVMLAAQTGISTTSNPMHLKNHAAYLNSWIACCSKDPMAIFSAAKDAQLISDYLLQLEATHKKEIAAKEALAPHRDWIREYERA